MYSRLVVLLRPRFCGLGLVTASSVFGLGLGSLGLAMSRTGQVVSKHGHRSMEEDQNYFVR